jgi:hypothetical protein
MASGIVTTYAGRGMVEVDSGGDLVGLEESREAGRTVAGAAVHDILRNVDIVAGDRLAAGGASRCECVH